PGRSPVRPPGRTLRGAIRSSCASRAFLCVNEPAELQCSVSEPDRAETSDMIRVVGTIVWLAAVAALTFGDGGIAAADPKLQSQRSFQPVVRPTPPDVRGVARTAVDRFILAALEAR